MHFLAIPYPKNKTNKVITHTVPNQKINIYYHKLKICRI